MDDLASRMRRAGYQPVAECRRKRLERFRSRFRLAERWGIAVLDYDNDGWLDLSRGESSSGGNSTAEKLEARLADVTKDVHLMRSS